jgi:hypothetical protein
VPALAYDIGSFIWWPGRLRTPAFRTSPNNADQPLSTGRYSG